MSEVHVIASAPSSVQLNPAQLRILRHMLGIDKPETDKPEPYRNYYCANPGEVEMLELVRLGAIEQYAAQGGYEWFQCTNAGRAAAIASHKTIQYSKAKRRYMRWLDISDVRPDITFGDFLRMKL
jgi:hypothetical protein